MYFKIIFLFIFAFSYASANITQIFNYDYHIYLGRGGTARGMAYVHDLNQRIAQQINIKNERTFTKLTKLLVYVLTTGAVFDIGKKASTQEQYSELKVSLTYIELLSQRLDRTLKSATQSECSLHIRHPKVRQYQNALKNPYQESTINLARDHVVFDEIKYTMLFIEKKEEIQRQGKALMRALNKVANDAKKIDFAHDKKYDNPHSLYTVTEDNRVILKDNLANTFYVMRTPADGACWMHSTALKKNDPYSNQEFAKRLLGLDENGRRKVCEDNFTFFEDTFFRHYKNLLKNKNVLRKRFNKQILPLYETRDEENSKKIIIDFLKEKDIFDAIVQRRGADHTDCSTLVTAEDKNTWQCVGSGWGAVLPQFLRHNIFQLCYVDYQPLPNSDSDTRIYEYSPDYPWAFLYQGVEDIHISALSPVEWEKRGKHHYLKRYADPAYFQKWHRPKTMDNSYYFPLVDEALKKKLCAYKKRLERLS